MKRVFRRAKAMGSFKDFRMKMMKICNLRFLKATRCIREVAPINKVSIDYWEYKLFYEYKNFNKLFYF